LLRTTDITSGCIIWDKVPFCKKEPPQVGKYLLKNGDIVISRAGSVGYSFLIRNPSNAVFASYLIRFRPLINDKYLALYLKSPYYWDFISEISLGISIPNVNASKLKQAPIPLPPLPEQHRIVAKIEELYTRLDAGVEALNRIKAELKRYRQAVLKSAFEGKLTEQWRPSIGVQHIEASEPNIGLPQGWTKSYLSEMGELSRGKSKHRPRDDKRLFEGKYPFIQTGDVKNSNGVMHSYNQTYNDIGLKQSRLWPVNTLCITIAANIAETALLGVSACFPDSIVGFIPNVKICDVKYVHFFFKTIKDNLESFAPATAQKNINMGTLKKVSVPLPPLSEQHRIVEEIESRCSVSDEINQVVDRTLKRAERLRQSILKRAFEGKLVSQDSRDEPASVLLERIKEERAKKGVEVRVKRGFGKRVKRSG